MKIYESFTGDELKVAEKIQQRRYQLLIHSCIYYHLNASIITDQKWSDWAVELCHLQTRYPEISRQVPLNAYFNDWDGSTGMFLPITLDWVVGTAQKLLRRKEPVKKVEKKRRLF